MIQVSFVDGLVFLNILKENNMKVMNSKTDFCFVFCHKGGLWYDYTFPIDIPKLLKYMKR